MPIFAVVGSLIVFGSRPDTQLFVFGTNFIPMLISGIFAGLLIRAANKSGSNKYLIALSPTWVLVAVGMLWYLMGLLNLGAGDSGREYFAGPFYLLGGSVIVGIIATIVYLVTPSSKSSA
ncbi:MAG: hypothetical protein ACR2P6_01225 [Gammaproteobacteria bacterium]